MVEAASPGEFPFTLPLGLRDGDGVLHREGTMRMATAFDEIAPLKDPRVQANAGYLVIILLARVITRLGTLTSINPKVVEGLLSGDLVFLQDLYQRINENGHDRLAVTCPHCQGAFEVETNPVGGIVSYPSDRLFEEVAYIARYLHWPYEQVMAIDHRERQRWVAEIARTNEALHEAMRGDGDRTVSREGGAVSFPLGLNAGLAGVMGALGKRLDPYLAHNFLVEIEGLIAGGFSQVGGLESSIATQDFQEGGVNGYVHKVLGGRTFPPLVLSHGLTDLDLLWQWYDRVSRGLITRKNGTVMLLDGQRRPVMWWSFVDALPVSWSGPSFDASAESQVAVERVELVHRGLSKPPENSLSAAARGLLAFAPVR